MTIDYDLNYVRPIALAVAWACSPCYTRYRIYCELLFVAECMKRVELSKKALDLMHIREGCVGLAVINKEIYNTAEAKTTQRFEYS